MERENFDGLDLFGNPVPRSRGKAGRPEKGWTQEKSNKINLLFATGREPKDAAKAVGLSMPTFRKHYFSELEEWRVARLKFEAVMLERLYAEGTKGNVAAIKELFKQMERGALARLSDQVANRKSAQPPKGKKEQQKDAADSYRGKFAPPSGPSLIN